MKSFFKKVESENVLYKVKYKLISEEEIRNNINSYDWVLRRTIASMSKCLDILVKDENFNVRYMVASQGYGLDILLKDKHWLIRSEAKFQLITRGLL